MDSSTPTFAGATRATPAPLQVLGRFLRALGVPGRRIGTDEAEAAALLRSELADRRMLLLLDNAQDAAQVRPLLPGAGPSDVIVTSRRRLPDLATAGVVNLEPLPRDDAIRLITSTARTPRLDADPDGASALAEACARLPLALRIAGSRLATRPEWTVTDLARRLDDGNRRLTELSLGESSVLNSFQLSYDDLNPMPSVRSGCAACILATTSAPTARRYCSGFAAAEADRVLEDLLEANMLMQQTKNRYRFHDLLGLYSRRLLAEDDEADTARTGLYSWYAEAVTAAIDWAYPQVVRLAPTPIRAGSSRPNPRPSTGSTTNCALCWRSPRMRRRSATARCPGESSTSSGATSRFAGTPTGGCRPRRPVSPPPRPPVTTPRSSRCCSTAARPWEKQAATKIALADCLAGQALAAAVGWTTAAAYRPTRSGGSSYSAATSARPIGGCAVRWN